MRWGRRIGLFGELDGTEWLERVVRLREEGGVVVVNWLTCVY